MDLLLLNTIAHKPPYQVTRASTASSCFSLPNPNSCVISCSHPVLGNFTTPILMYALQQEAEPVCL